LLNAETRGVGIRSRIATDGLHPSIAGIFPAFHSIIGNVIYKLIINSVFLIDHENSQE